MFSTKVVCVKTQQKHETQQKQGITGNDIHYQSAVAELEEVLDKFKTEGLVIIGGDLNAEPVRQITKKLCPF